MNASLNIDAERSKLRKRIEAERAERGRAILDGGQFDESSLVAAEKALAALADAENEAGRREIIDREIGNRERYADLIARYKTARATRIDAVTKAEKTCRAFAAALTEFFDANEAERAICAELDPGGIPAAFTRANLENRALGYIRPILRGTVGGNYLGHLNIGPMPSDLAAADNWRDAESRVSDMLAHFERMAPK